MQIISAYLLRQVAGDRTPPEPSLADGIVRDLKSAREIGVSGDFTEFVKGRMIDLGATHQMYYRNPNRTYWVGNYCEDVQVRTSLGTTVVIWKSANMAVNSSQAPCMYVKTYTIDRTTVHATVKYYENYGSGFRCWTYFPTTDEQYDVKFFDDDIEDNTKSLDGVLYNEDWSYEYNGGLYEFFAPTFAARTVPIFSSSYQCQSYCRLIEEYWIDPRDSILDRIKDFIEEYDIDS